MPGSPLHIHIHLVYSCNWIQFFFKQKSSVVRLFCFISLCLIFRFIEIFYAARKKNHSILLLFDSLPMSKYFLIDCINYTVYVQWKKRDTKIAIESTDTFNQMFSKLIFGPNLLHSRKKNNNSKRINEILDYRLTVCAFKWIERCPYCTFSVSAFIFSLATVFSSLHSFVWWSISRMTHSV